MGKEVDSVLQRMTIVGVILCFKELIDESLNMQLEERIPFLYSTISDVHEHSLPDQTMIINEMAASAGFNNKLDPLLIHCIQSLPKQDHDDEYMASCLLMVFVAVSIPK